MLLVCGQYNQFCVDVWVLQVKYFGVDLMELVVVIFLWVFVMEYWFDVLQMLFLIVQQIMFDVGMYVVCCFFWMQCQVVVIVVFEGIYFFFNYVGYFVDCVFE